MRPEQLVQQQLPALAEDGQKRASDSPDRTRVSFRDKNELSPREWPFDQRRRQLLQVHFDR